MPSPRRPIILDVEASGLGANSYPIEVGVVMETGERFSRIIKPEPGWTDWDPAAESLHQISREVLATHGRSVAEVARELNDLLANKIAYSDGWVVDKPWISQLFHAAGMPIRFHLSPLELILIEPQMSIWHDEKQAVEIALAATRHRASHDAWIIQETFVRSRALVSTPIRSATS
ncbi:MAG: hypothetical protein AB8C46_10045 [Burkholderiaceae bacterium]